MALDGLLLHVINTHLQKLCPGATFGKPFSAYGKGGSSLEKELRAWLSANKLSLK